MAAKTARMCANSREVTASIDFRSIPTMALRGPFRIYRADREARVYGWDGMGWMDEISKVSFDFHHVQC